MNWWSLFFKIRKTVFAFIAIASLGWAITLSIYLAREWSHFTHPQRGLVLGIIGVNGITWLLLYLMIVVVFRPWLDFARVLFLLLMHVGGSLAVTLFSLHFSCIAFATEKVCKEVDLGFIIGSWALTGLLLGYMFVLLIMTRVPRPMPRVTPNLLLDDPEKSSHSRTASLRSVNSATGLLRKDSTSSFGDTAPDTGATRPRRGRRTYRVANGMPDTPATARTPSWASPRAAYGATESSSRPAVPRLPPIQTSFSQARRQSSLRQPPPQPLPLSNPFEEPLPRGKTRDSMISALTFSADQSVTYSTWTTGLGLGKYQPVVPPLPSTVPASAATAQTATPSSASMSRYSRSIVDSPTSIYSLYGSRPPEYFPANTASSDIPQYGTPTPVWSAGASLRTQTATPHSIHSVAPSMHLTHDISPPVPPRAHMAGGNDPIWRPYTADPHLNNDPPNHFQMVGNAEVRRLPTMPNAQYQRTGHGGTYVASRNAAHLAGALGKTPPRSESAVADREQWRQLVMKAAGSRTL